MPPLTHRQRTSRNPLRPLGLGAEQLQAAENYLTETVTETIDAQDLPVYENLEEQFDEEFEAISWHGHEPTKRGGHSPDGAIRGKSRMPAGTIFAEFLEATVSTVKNPEYFAAGLREYIFTKFIRLKSGSQLLFQVKINRESGKITHAYPVVGEGMTVYNPKQEEPTPAIFRDGVLGKEIKRVQR